jgi:hypothetical protein
MDFTRRGGVQRLAQGFSPGLLEPGMRSVCPPRLREYGTKEEKHLDPAASQGANRGGRASPRAARTCHKTKKCIFIRDHNPSLASNGSRGSDVAKAGRKETRKRSYVGQAAIPPIGLYSTSRLVPKISSAATPRSW